MSTAKNGNVPKHTSFAWATQQMKAAHAAGFHLEAIALAESSLRDRIWSYLHGTAAVQLGANHATVGALAKHAVFVAANPELSGRTVQWGKNRNAVIHAVVKSPPGQAPMPIADYRSLAASTAAEGIELVRLVGNWHKREKRRSKTP